MTIGQGEPAAPAASESESVQPPETNGQQPGSPAGEGQGGFGDLYDLSAAPEELRPFLEQELRKVESNVNGKLREHADYRKRWEPFEAVDGLSDLDPESLSELVKFHEVASDPDAFLDWWGGVTENIDPNDPEMTERLEQAWEQIGERHGFFEDGGSDEGLDGDDDDFGDVGGDAVMGDEPPAWAQELIEDVQQLKGTTVESQEQQRKEAASKWVDSERKRLDPDSAISDEDWDGVVCKLALGYDVNDDKALEKAVNDYRRIKGEGGNELVESAEQRPGPSVSGGQPDTRPEKFGGLDDPDLKAAVKARFKGAVGS